MRIVAVLVLLASAGCASTLPPHVWLPIEHVEGADLFWWTAAKQCSLRVIWWAGPDDVRSFQVPVDAALCVERLKADGYDLKGQP